MYKFIEQESGPLRIFRLPEPGMTYTVGIDGSTGFGKDYSCFQVLCNMQPFEQVARFRARWPANKVSEWANMVLRFYNDALNICEINYPGNSIQDQLVTVWKYPNNYRQEEHLDSDPNISEKYGMRTTESTKWMMITEVQKALEERNLILHDPDTIAEFMNFVYIQDKHKAGAAEGFNDDTVMAMLMALHGAILRPMPGRRQVKNIHKPDPEPEAKAVWNEFRQKMLTPKTKKVVVL